MENRQFIKRLLLVTGMLCIPVFGSHAYDNETTHPALTQEIIKLFEHQYPNFQLTQEEKDSLEKGSIEEDLPNFRCLTHFYDPVYERGLYGNFSAKQWAEATAVQAVLDAGYLAQLGNVSQPFFASKTDFSWKRAVFEYVYGDKLRGLESLGHVLHLIEDMAVPPHTRNDAHALGSPYEDYAKIWTKDQVNIAESLIKTEKKPLIYNNLEDYFYNLALFTNQNFFSKDTILSKKYFEPLIEYEKSEILSDGKNFKFGFNKIDSHLIRIREYFDFETKKLKRSLIFQDKDNLIFTDYWNALSEQAVLYGAGVMKLFFEAVEEEQQTLALYKKNKSIFDVVVLGVTDLSKKTVKTLSNLASMVKNSLAKVDSRDLLASIDLPEENGGEGDLDGGDSGVEIGSENSQFPPQNLPVVSQGSPEDSGSPELKRLALILKEVEKMVARLEKDIGNISNQNIGGSVGENLIVGDISSNSGSGNGNNGNSNSGNNNYGGGGGGGGGGASADTPTPTSTAVVTTTVSTTSTTITTATTTAVTIDPPVVVSPANFSQFATTTITFSGTASSTQIISTDFSSATTTVDQSNNWELTLPNFLQGTTTILFFANYNQITSSPTGLDIFVDAIVATTTTTTATTTPVIIPVAVDAPLVEISQCSSLMSDSTCLAIATNLDIFWATTTPCADFSHFNIENNGVFFTTTATTTQIIDITDNSTYTFSVAVVDTNGNSSATTTQTVIIKTMPVVINEIAWAGTDASSADEWVELYNRSDVDINLSDWVLYAEDLSPVISFSGAVDKVIEANSYYLIERTDDTVVNDISADFSTPFSGWGTGSGLSNNGEHLILAYKKGGQATTTVDEVAFAPDEGGWPERSKICFSGRCRTLEKYNADLFGTDRDNWGLSIGQYILNGHDADGATIKGTPKARNSINYKIAKGNILSEDKTITKANSPYFVGSDGLTIEVGKTLTIESGVIIKTIRRYGDAEIIVNGSIQAKGLVSEPIIFTSFVDDVGGDTNGDGACVSPECPGDNNFWSQVVLTSDSENSYFNNTIFRYGGNRLYTTYPNAMVVVEDTNVDFADTTFIQSISSGLHLTSAVATVENCNFIDGKKIESYTDLYTYFGLYALGGEIVVRDSIFDNNQVGLGLSDSSGAVINSNVFNNNADYAVVVGNPTNLETSNNSGSNNGKNGIKLFGYITNENLATVLDYNSLPYIIDNVLIVSKGSSLEISPKTVFKFDKNGRMGVDGYLWINGGTGEENRVLFTSLFDDGSIATSSIQREGGINLSSASSTIENVEFRYLDEATNYIDLANYYSGVPALPSAINLKDVIYKYNYWSIKTDTIDNPIFRAENVVCDQGTTNTTGICQ